MVCGRGLWKDALWRTYDLLIRLGYPGYNFETHTPAYLTRKRVMAAYCDSKDFVTEDRFYWMLGLTAILNHAYKLEKKHDKIVRGKKPVRILGKASFV